METIYHKPRILQPGDESIQVNGYLVYMRFSDRATPGVMESIGNALNDQIQVPGINAIFCNDGENMR